MLQDPVQLPLRETSTATQEAVLTLGPRALSALEAIHASGTE
jgi:hypothetical protein